MKQFHLFQLCLVPILYYNEMNPRLMLSIQQRSAGFKAIPWQQTEHAHEPSKHSINPGWQGLSQTSALLLTQCTDCMPRTIMAPCSRPKAMPDASKAGFTLGSLDTFARRPSCVADSSVMPKSTAAAAYCHRTVGLGCATMFGSTWNATLQNTQAE